jgi:16S rRNA (guanine527-N7)-methyltransferase
MIFKDLASLDLPLPQNAQENFTIYCELLLKWNKTHNLSGATTSQKVYEFLYDSLYPMTLVPKPTKVLDVGSGAGFPAIALAILYPDVTFELVEPLQKRIAFLNFVKIKAKLTNITLHTCRLEAMPTSTYDLITSKAVMGANLLYKISTPFMDENSKILMYKGRNTNDETEGLQNLKVFDTTHSRYLLIGKN